MSRTNFYDVIVIGSLPTALMAGGLLRRRGYRTLLIQQDGLSNHYKHGNISIPYIPTLLPPRNHAPIFEQVLQTIGLEDPVHQLGKHEALDLQVITPQNRIDIPANLRALETELHRALPDEKTQILRVLGRIQSFEEHYTAYLEAQTAIPARGLLASSKPKKTIRSLKQFAPPELESWPQLLRILAASTTFNTNVDHLSRSLFTTGHLVLGLIRGLRMVPDFRKLLFDGFQKIGGEVQRDTIVEEIEFDGRNPSGVTTLHRSMTFRCTTLLSAVPIRHTMDLIPLRKRRRRMRLVLDTVRPSMSMFTVNFLYPTECLPLGMGKHLILVRNPDEPLVEDNLLRILCLPSAEQPDTTLINLSCLIPYQKRKLGRAYLESLQERIRDTIEWIIPFFKKHLQSSSSPFINPVAEETLPANSPWKHHQTYETSQHDTFNETIVPVETPYRNMFFCGPEVMPALGLEGSAKTAREVVELISEQNKIKKIL